MMSFNSVMADNRTPIVVSQSQKDALLAEMRELLKTSQEVLEGVVNKDMEMVEKSARLMGINATKTIPPGVGKLLPSGFKSMGPQVHKGFERIANEADGFGDTDKILKILSDTQKVCTACHSVYQFTVKK